MNDYAINLLRYLISIDSVNPSLVPGGAGETEIADAVAEELRKIGLDVVVEDAAPGRPNVVGVLEGRAPGRSLMYCGHLDTVGVAGMNAPFDPVEREGRLYGRGSQDMKGGLASMIAAARSLAASGLAFGRLVVATVADEEYASIGAVAVVKRWHADGAVVLEPTDLEVGVAHKGFSWVEVVTRGRAAHGSRPAEGRDAILGMGRVLAGLESLNRELQSRPPHPLVGNASLHASLIAGGRELSTYPDRCTLQLERRTISGESAETALSEVHQILERLTTEDPEFSADAKSLFGQPPYEIPNDHDLPGILQSELVRHNRAAKSSGMTFWTDAAILGQAGIPSVIFGPGGAGLHGLEEYVRIDEVLVCRDVLIEATRAFCAPKSRP